MNNINIFIKGVDVIENKIIKIGQVSNEGSQSGSVYSIEGISPTVCACTHGYAIGNIATYKCNNTNKIGIKLPFLNKEEDFIHMKDIKNNSKELVLFDAFSGIGAIHKSNKRIGMNVKLIGSSEVDPYAIMSYAIVYFNRKEIENVPLLSEKEMKDYLLSLNIGWDFKKKKSTIKNWKGEKLKRLYQSCIITKNYGDISKINYSELPDFDLLNFSFSCQDYSQAGKGKGKMDKNGNLTRSGQYVYGIELIKHKKPPYVMIENVKGLIQNTHINDFYSIINELGEIGYNCYYPKNDKDKPICLNAKDFGVPQNRERIFVICIRKDIDTYDFEFPIGRDYGIRLKDILEDEVDEKYYLSEEIQKRFKFNGNKDLNRNELNQIGTTGEDKTIGQRDRTYGTNGIIANLTSTDYKQPKQIIEYNNTNNLNKLGFIGNEDSQGNRVYATNGIAATQVGNAGGLGAKTGLYLENNNDNLPPVPELVGGIGEINFGKQFRQGNRVYSSEKTVMCLLSQPVGNAGGFSYLYKTDNYRIRKLTPLECLRLMGFDDEDYYKMKEIGISDTRIYQLAGNSIVVNVLEAIFRNLFHIN